MFVNNKICNYLNRIRVIFVERRGCLLDDLSMIRTDSCTWHRKRRWNFERQLHESKLARFKVEQESCRARFATVRELFWSWLSSVQDRFTCNWQWVNRLCRSDSNLVSSRHWTRIDKSFPVFEATVYITSSKIRVKLSRDIKKRRKML